MEKSNCTPKKQQQEGSWRGSYMRNNSQLQLNGPGMDAQERSALGRLLNATIVVCGACYILYVAVYLGLDLREIVAKPSQEPVKVKLYIRSKGSQWEGQPLQLHSAGHSSVPPLDASSELSYAERDEGSSNTIAEPVPGLSAGESVAEAARAGLDETGPPSARSSEGSERDIDSPGDPAGLDISVRDSLPGLSMPDNEDEVPGGPEAADLAHRAADSLEDVLRSDSRDRRSSEGPHGEALGHTAETEEAAELQLADEGEGGVASLSAAADDGEAMQLSESSRSGQRLGGEAAAESDSSSPKQEREDASLHLPASEHAAGVDAETNDAPLPAALEGAAEMDGEDNYMPRSASDSRAELEEEELSLPLLAAADTIDMQDEEELLPVYDNDAEGDSFVA